MDSDHLRQILADAPTPCHLHVVTTSGTEYVGVPQIVDDTTLTIEYPDGPVYIELSTIESAQIRTLP